MEAITERLSDEGTSKRSSDEIYQKQRRLKSIAKSIMSRRDKNSNDTNGASLKSFEVSINYISNIK
jgi:CheY-like chemotaxis protein